MMPSSFQIELLACVIDGMSVDKIASRFGISEAEIAAALREALLTVLDAAFERGPVDEVDRSP